MRRSGGMIAALVAGAGLLAAAGCGKKGADNAGRQLAPVVKGAVVAAVAGGEIPDLLEAVGTVRARNAAQVSARIAGVVTAVNVREGDRVSRGKLLLTLDAVERTAELAGARAGVDEAQRGVEEVRARKKLADDTFERFRRLYGEQAVTRQEFENRQADRDVSAQELARAEARLVQARENARAAGALAGYTRITAPISGIVTGKSVDSGMTVFPGTPLLTVEEEGHFRLEAAVPEALLGKIRVNDTVPVTIDGMAAGMKGRVAEVVPAVDAASRTFTVKVDVAGQGLRSGVFGRARFAGGMRQGIMIPRGALVERGALTSVWVVEKDGSARMRLVKTGAAAGERVEILAGLAPGERIVVGGVEKIVDGSKLE